MGRKLTSVYINEGNLQIRRLVPSRFACSFFVWSVLFNQINGEFYYVDVVFFLNGVHVSDICHGIFNENGV